MSEDRRDEAEADEDGGGRVEEYEKIKTLRRCAGNDGDTITKYKSLWII